MINTYQTSLAPPPVPPRMNRTSPVLIPAAAPSHGYSKPLIRFLVGLVLLHLLLSFVGFFYLYHTTMSLTMCVLSPSAALLTSGGRSHNAMARMTVKQPSYWNMGRSFYRNINYYRISWLTVLQPGDYYVYARVTFSRGHPKIPLASRVTFRESETAKENEVMKAYCSLESQSSGLCTATQGEVITLKAGNQLSVWVQDLSLVDYEEGATTFGMYQL
uniref:THD domain-containing protein n=1 Tax=Myripristis murdjan TaxID=586833 RepID=A0A667WS84_9TELE